MSDFDISEELKKLPGKPGVYIMHDQRDAIIYVGKAVSLKNRVRQYFQSQGGKSPKVQRMVRQIDHFEYIVTDSELEALVLESNLIKEHRPKYNTMLKDDKSYPYICVTTGEAYPRVLMVRSMKKDSSRYFGPYPTAGAVHDMIDLVHRIFGLRDCGRRLPAEEGKERPCLNYHIGQCPAPCQGWITPEAYQENVRRALDFLNGRVDGVVSELEKRMLDASQDMRFEEAASIRDLIESIRIIGEKQKITATNTDDRDIIALAMDREETEEGTQDGTLAAEQDGTAEGTGPPGQELRLPHMDAVVQVFFVRGGRLIGREHFFLRVEDTDERGQVLSDFISQYYAGTPFVPSELMLEEPVPDQELIREWLTERRGGKVEIRIPKRGMKEKLVELARQNAELVLSRDRERLRREELRTRGAVREISSLLSIEKADRMEAYDISNISGFESVGSMIVYDHGRPKRTDYRKFRIRSVEGPNDYASMEEVLTRRFARAREGSQGFALLPDLILMDGGKGQVHAAERVLKEQGFSIPVAGMVKDDYHRTRGLYFQDRELPIDRSSEGFKLITRIQDEAHRFAIEYHRLLRSKGQVRSVLDGIEGIGGARRKALMRAFESIEAIREAGIEQLAAVPSMNRRAAEAVYAFFHNLKEEAADEDSGITQQAGGGAEPYEPDT